MPESKGNHTKRYASGNPSLSNHVNASQLSFYTWDKLKQSVHPLSDKGGPSQASSRALKTIELLFEVLEPIESYWAFPGKYVLFEL